MRFDVSSRALLVSVVLSLTKSLSLLFCSTVLSAVAEFSKQVRHRDAEVIRKRTIEVSRRIKEAIVEERSKRAQEIEDEKKVLEAKDKQEEKMAEKIDLDDEGGDAAEVPSRKRARSRSPSPGAVPTQEDDEEKPKETGKRGE